MAYKDAGTPSVGTNALVSGVNAVLDTIGKTVVSLMKSVEAASAANARYQAVVKLQGKTDDELAELGLKRDDIVRYVFRDLYYC